MNMLFSCFPFNFHDILMVMTINFNIITDSYVIYKQHVYKSGELLPPARVTQEIMYPVAHV